jgi:hypothetical protein
MTNRNQRLLRACITHLINCIGGVMVSILASSEVDCGFQSLLSQTKDYKIGICCFSAKHATIGERAKTGWIE